MTTATGVSSVAWIAAAGDVLQRISDTQELAIAEASAWCADAIAAGGLVHVFGTGHSRMAVEEMFPRYGSFPGFHPIVELSMTFHTPVVGANGQRQAMFIERTPGLAEVILSNFTFGPADVMIVFSASGSDRRPRGDRARRPNARRAGDRGDVRRAVACRTEPGTASGAGCSTRRTLSSTCARRTRTRWSTIDGLETPVGPGSTIAAVAIVNCIKVRTAQLLVERGAMPPGHHPSVGRRRRTLAGRCSRTPIVSMRSE